MIDQIKHKPIKEDKNINKKALMKIGLAFLLLLLLLAYFASKNNTKEFTLESETTEDKGKNQKTKKSEIVVEVSGGVAKPCLVTLEKGSRVYEAINLAGGISPYGDLVNMELSKVLEDEEKLYVPTTSIRHNYGGQIPIKRLVPEEEGIYVSVCGEIRTMGIIVISKESRVNDVIVAADGTTDQADLTQVNLAEKVTDNMSLFIPSKVEPPVEGDESSQTGSNKESGKININTADLDALCQLTGVGPAIGAAIIEYRLTNGKFKTIEDIKNVSGIGEKTFEKFKDQLSVR